MFFRSLFALPVILAWLWSRDELRTGVRTQNLRAHFARGIVGSCAMGLGFAGLRFLPSRAGQVDYEPRLNQIAPGHWVQEHDPLAAILKGAA